MNPVISREIQRTIHVDQVFRFRTRRAFSNVPDHNRSLRRAVALPQFFSMDSVFSCEVQRAIHVDQGFKSGRIRKRNFLPRFTTRIDVLDHHRFIRSALPQLDSMNAIIGTEIQCAIYVHQLGRTGRSRLVDVLDHHRFIRSALPQLYSIIPIVGTEIQRSVHVDQLGRTGRSRLVDVLDQLRSILSVLPQFDSMTRIIGGEEECAVQVD